MTKGIGDDPMPLIRTICAAKRLVTGSKCIVAHLDQIQAKQIRVFVEAAPCAGARNGIYIQRVRVRGGVRFPQPPR
jgi:hypothetical protein